MINLTAPQQRVLERLVDAADNNKYLNLVGGSRRAVRALVRHGAASEHGGLFGVTEHGRVELALHRHADHLIARGVTVSDAIRSAVDNAEQIIATEKRSRPGAHASVASEWVQGSVVAEDAPIGLQLWPTQAPEYAPNFTLASVSLVRDAYGTHVVWTYESGNVRNFSLGETVAVETEKPLV